MGEFVFWSWTMKFHCCQKKAFSPVSLHKTIFCHENSKPPWKTTYTIGELGSRRFFEPGFEVSKHSYEWARILTTLWPTNQGEHLNRLIYIWLSPIAYQLHLSVLQLSQEAVGPWPFHLLVVGINIFMSLVPHPSVMQVLLSSTTTVFLL